jgi:hypothetical protein
MSAGAGEARTATFEGSLLDQPVKNAPIFAAIFAHACVSGAKWPVSKKWTSAAGNVTPARLGAGRQEQRIVLPPDRQERRRMRPQGFLERRVERSTLRRSP